MRKRLSALVAALLVAIILPAAVLAAHWPVDNRYSYVSQGYWSGHRAYDLASYLGTPVTPVKSGTVIFHGWRNNCGGYQVWLSHGDGLYTAYYHLQSGSIAVWNGEWVTADSTRIARVGESGCATGAHLHVEVWRGYPWASGSYRVSPWVYIDGGTWLPYRYR